MATYIKRGNATKVEDFIKRDIVDTKREYHFDCKNAIDIINDAISKNEKITIMGDYDCDGVCATAIMATALRVMGCNPSVRLPKRFTEGYGMKESMVEEVDSGLIITVDNGIASVPAIKAAKDKGLRVIVTDHHVVPSRFVPKLLERGIRPQEEFILPKADCIINPHYEQAARIKGHYDYYDYCGAGVALKIAEQLIGKDNPVMNKLYAYAALATVADVMPVTGDNRNILIRGITAMANGETSKGLYYLLAQNKIDINSIPAGILPYNIITGDVLGYKLGPCINAASRLLDAGATKALLCLLSEKDTLALSRVTELIELNEQRKRETEREQKIVDKTIKDNGMENDCPIVIHLPESAPGIIGLHAGRLCEQYEVPVIVINGHGENCKGSCRSVEGANIKKLLDYVQDCLVGYGGHPGAAGLTITEDKIDEFRDRLQTKCRLCGIKSTKTDNVEYDLRLEEKDLPHAIDVLSKTLAPFGEGNPEPVFLIDVKINDINILGGKHLKVSGDGITGIGFNLGGEGCLPESFKEGKTCTLLGTVGYNCFRGEAKPQINILSVLDKNARIIECPEEPEEDFEL